MSNDEIILLVGGILATVLGLIDLIRTNYQSLAAAGVAVLGVALILVALID